MMPFDAVLRPSGLDRKRGSVCPAGRADAGGKRRSSSVAAAEPSDPEAGVWRDSVAPIFPSYVFLQSPVVDPDLYAGLKRTPGFVRFLPSNEALAPLEQKDQGLLSHFLSFGEIVQRSTAIFDENKRIRVISGPLKNLEGLIVRVDRRKGRARVRLEMYEDSFEVDFGFEALDTAASSPAKES